MLSADPIRTQELLQTNQSAVRSKHIHINTYTHFGDRAAHSNGRRHTYKQTLHTSSWIMTTKHNTSTEVEG